MTARYEVLSHTADTGIVAYGTTLEELFETAAFAMFDLMFGIGFLPGDDQVRIEMEVTARSVEDLLVDWLSLLLFEAETRDLALCSFEVEVLEDGRLVGRVRGLPSAEIELTGPPIKAVTYHDLSVERVPTGWSAQIVFDV
jgi:SHS2 domain-containing protein